MTIRERKLRAIRYDGAERTWIVECDMCGLRYVVETLRPDLRCPECGNAGNGPEMKREYEQRAKP